MNPPPKLFDREAEGTLGGRRPSRLAVQLADAFAPCAQWSEAPAAALAARRRARRRMFGLR